MSNSKVLGITLLVVVIVTMTVVTAQVDLDANRGYYSTKVSVQRGGSQLVEIIIRGFDQVEIVVSPTIDPIEIQVRDPQDRIIVRDQIIIQKKILVNIETKGLWKIVISYPSTTATASSQDVYVEVIGKTVLPVQSPAPRPAQTQGPVLPWELIGIIGGSVVAVVIVAIAVLAFRKKPATPAPPTPQPPPTPPTSPPAPTPSVSRSEETIVMEKAPSAKETEMILAAFELSDGRILPVTSPRQIFGRTDFERYVGPELLKYVSRRHFMIYLEPGGFFIEDLGSANGTIVNGSDIRGKGKVPLKPGDVVEVGGVIKLKFKTGA